MRVHHATFYNGELEAAQDVVRTYYQEGLNHSIVDDLIVLTESASGITVASYLRGEGWTIRTGQHKGEVREWVSYNDNVVEAPAPEQHEHVILTALVVETHLDRQEAMTWLGRTINATPNLRQWNVGDSEVRRTHVNSWWFAEDDRTDGSDCESAVFIPYDFQRVIKQGDARRILEAAWPMLNEEVTDGPATVDQVCAVIGNPDIYPEPEPTTKAQDHVAFLLDVIGQRLGEAREAGQDEREGDFARAVTDLDLHIQTLAAIVRSW